MQKQESKIEIKAIAKISVVVLTIPVVLVLGSSEYDREEYYNEDIIMHNYF